MSQLSTPRRSFPPAPERAHTLLLTAHPLQDGFNTALGLAWAHGAAAAGVQVDVIDVHALDFETRLRSAYREDQPLEPDLVRVRDAIAQAAHVTIATPIWWSSVPAALKGLFDRVLLPGWAYRYENGLPVGGLTGRSARLLVTMDAPVWYDTLVNHRAGRHQVARGVLRFCGFGPVRTRTFGAVGQSTEAQRAAMLLRAETDGRVDGERLVRRLGAVPALPASAG